MNALLATRGTSALLRGAGFIEVGTLHTSPHLLLCPRAGTLAPIDKSNHSPSDEQLSPVFLQV